MALAIRAICRITTMYSKFTHKLGMRSIPRLRERLHVARPRRLSSLTNQDIPPFFSCSQDLVLVDTVRLQRLILLDEQHYHLQLGKGKAHAP